MTEIPKNRYQHVWTASIPVWLIILLLTPTINNLSEGDHLLLMTSLGVLAMSVSSLVALASRWNKRSIAKMALVVTGFCLLVEIIGSRTGFPFGHYSYSKDFSLQVWDVPLLIPLAWLMMIIPAWGVTSLLLPSRAGGRTIPDRLAFAGLAGLVMTAWDLFVDPQMVAFGLWEWKEPSGYFGIPLTNFAGWWLTSFCTTLVINPRNLPRFQLLVLYSLTLVFEAVGLGLIFGHPFQALAGTVIMGGFAFAAWSRYLISIRNPQVLMTAIPERTSD